MWRTFRSETCATGMSSQINISPERGWTSDLEFSNEDDVDIGTTQVMSYAHSIEP